MRNCSCMTKQVVETNLMNILATIKSKRKTELFFSLFLAFNIWSSDLGTLRGVKLQIAISKFDHS